MPLMVNIYHVQAKPCPCWMAVMPDHFGYHC